MTIMLLQKKLGLKPDGVFGPVTIKAAKTYYNLTDYQAAHFFGQCSHETGNFTVFSENLNYSAEGLLKIFGKYFNPTTANQYARKPEAIANRVYANRMGNGAESSGDGWKFRGRGAIQLTGKSNYLSFATSINKPEIMNNPDLVSSEYSFESAKFFFDNKKIWIQAKSVDVYTITAVTKLVNGGINGLPDRIEKTQKYYKWLTS